MADCLYVCHFSNGHIKVGRSIDPVARIASHADRVACMGVELVERHVVECADSVGAREAILIAQCADAANTRHLNEWFVGLEFESVCEWANAAASKSLESAESEHRDSFGYRLKVARRAAGLTQAELGKGLGTDGVDVGKAVVSGWEQEQHFPRIDQLLLICRRLGVSADGLLFQQSPQSAHSGV